MPGRIITDIVIHCSASPDGVSLARTDRAGRRFRSAAQAIDEWHRKRGFNRAAWRLKIRPGLKHIGYHYVIDVDGARDEGRTLAEPGAHVAGHNASSIGICMVGTDRFTADQWASLAALVQELRAQYPAARIRGHRDFSPDKNGNGRIERNEWLKTCPGFDVAEWLAAKFATPAANLFAPTIKEGTA